MSQIKRKPLISTISSLCPIFQKIKIIKTGFQLQAEGTISLKKYYETKQEYSLFQLKGYNIKYEAIRKSKLYKQLKPSNN